MMTLNTTANISTNLTANNSLFISTYASTEYVTTKFMTTIEQTQEPNVGISKALMYISAAIFLVIIISLIVYCIFRCRKHRKKIKQSKKPVNNIDIDEDTAKIQSFEVHVTKNVFALHNAKNAYAINPLNRVSTVSNDNINHDRYHSTNTSIELNKIQTIASITNSFKIKNSPLQIQTQVNEVNEVDEVNEVIQFVRNSPININTGDELNEFERNRTGTIEYTSKPTEEKIQAMLENVDTPDADIDDNDNDNSSISSDEMPVQIEMPVVDTLTAMIQRHQSGEQLQANKKSGNDEQNEQNEQDEQDEDGDEDIEEDSDSYEMFTPVPLPEDEDEQDTSQINKFSMQ